MVPLVLEGKGKGRRVIWNYRDHGLMVPLVPEGKGNHQGLWTHNPKKNKVRSRDHKAIVPIEIKASDPIWLGVL
jgi:hypothetical protein